MDARTTAAQGCADSCPLAVLLLTGTLTRAAAAVVVVVVGFAQSIAIGLTVANAGEWYWSYLLMAALHVAVFALAAGRYYGVDAT